MVKMVMVMMVGLGLGAATAWLVEPRGVVTEQVQDAAGDQAESPFSPALQPSPTMTLWPTPAPRLSAGSPVRVVIPAIQINAEVEKVGLTGNNAIAVPRDANKVGWFTRRARPGEKGGAILAGHYDTPTGKPAVFSHLGELKIGDEVRVATDRGEELVFTVESVLKRPYQSFPLDIIFQAHDKEKLIMITCDGVWDTVKRGYSDRLVVWADLRSREQR